MNRTVLIDEKDLRRAIAAFLKIPTDNIIKMERTLGKYLRIEYEERK